jgi:enamine deaminase RidA (YjgF/YER057c/UK114 family)
VKRISTLVVAVCLVLIVAVGASAQGKRARQRRAAPSVEYLTGERARPLPFSDAVRVGHMLYLSGQIGTDSCPAASSPRRGRRSTT